MNSWREKKFNDPLGFDAKYRDKSSYDHYADRLPERESSQETGYWSWSRAADITISAVTCHEALLAYRASMFASEVPPLAAGIIATGVVSCLLGMSGSLLPTKDGANEIVQSVPSLLDPFGAMSFGIGLTTGDPKVALKTANVVSALSGVARQTPKGFGLMSPSEKAEWAALGLGMNDLNQETLESTKSPKATKKSNEQDFKVGEKLGDFGMLDPSHIPMRGGNPNIFDRPGTMVS